jgi:hypothetical protein
MAMFMFKNLDRIKLPYGIVYIEGRVVFIYDSVCHSKFIFTESPDCKFFEPLKKHVGCKVPKVNMTEYPMSEGDIFYNVSSHYRKFEKCIYCKCVLCIRNPTTSKRICLEALE